MQIEAGWLLASITAIVGTLASVIAALFRYYAKSRDDQVLFLTETIEWQRGEIEVLTRAAREAVQSGHEVADVAITQRRRA